MTEFGYTAMGEQTPVRQLVTDLIGAEAAGFDFSVMSDHYFPWVENQGHSPYAWSVLGAAAQATERLPLMTFVTCPTFRYHPAVVAQKAATMGELSQGRFTLGLGAGENLNEHVVGAGWPVPRVRQERLAEAVQIIRKLFTGDYVNFDGKHYTVERARLYDLPKSQVPIGIALSGPDSVQLAAEHGDAMITTVPDAGLVKAFAKAGGKDKPRYGQMAICYDTDLGRAIANAQRLWSWAAPGWFVMSELPEPRSFEAAAQSVTQEQITDLVPCGPDVEAHVAAAKKWVDAGFTHLALVQIGAASQKTFLNWAERELLPALRKLG
ncbi:MAG: TIGR03557 family F420-dependent LLM class oxidoreductase [Streptosporangiaceae bacterium]